MDPSAPNKPVSGLASALRRARLRPLSARPSSGEAPVKRKESYQPREHISTSEPTGKRRKRAMPYDAITGTSLDEPDDTRAEPVDHSDADDVPFKKLAALRKPTPFSVGHATTSGAQTFTSNSDDRQVDANLPSPSELAQLALRNKGGIHWLVLQQKSKISKLEAELVEQRDFTEAAQNRVKQDMYIDIMHERDLRKKTEERADRAKRRYDREISELRVKLEKADEKSLLERQQTVNAQSSAESYRMESEHLENVNSTLQSDLNELRIVDVEDARARKDGRRDLPPAYGNLDDENRFPPYSQHADGGSIEVAHLKREIRRRFEMKVDEGLAKADEGHNVFSHISMALEDMSHSLKTLMDNADDVPVSHSHSQSNRFITQQMRAADMTEQITAMTGQHTGTPGAVAGASVDLHDSKHGMTKTDKRTRRRERKAANHTPTLMQSANAAPYIADRIAKLLLDLLWRAVAACDIRPIHHNNNIQMVGATLAVSYTSVDETLISALRLAFSKTSSISSFQYYLTQLEILAKQFKGLVNEMSGGLRNRLSDFAFFDKTLLWLNDQIEKERELRANEQRVLRVSTVVDVAGFVDADDDGVSSRWEGSDAGSGSEAD